jgi:hypothetical protein
VYKALPDGAYAEIEMVGEAVSKGLTLPVLSNSKLRLWLEDTDTRALNSAVFTAASTARHTSA